MGDCHATKIQHHRRNEEQCCHYGSYIPTSHAELLKIELVSVYCLLKLWNYSGKVKSGDSKRMRTWSLPLQVNFGFSYLHDSEIFCPALKSFRILGRYLQDLRLRHSRWLRPGLCFQGLICRPGTRPSCHTQSGESRVICILNLKSQKYLLAKLK